MTTDGLAAAVHKWLALLLAVPILFWFGSGLFFAAVPIERVRSEHVKAVIAPSPVPLDVASAGLARLAAQGTATGDRIEVKTLNGRAVAMVAGSDRPRLYDLVSGRLISPLTGADAAAIARADHVGAPAPIGTELVNSKSPDYRGALPAWRVDFTTGTNRSIYVAADTGAVTARRSTLWKVYDFLWGLHILDLRDHEDFNTPLLIGTVALALVLLVSGLVLLPRSLSRAWRARRWPASPERKKAHP